MTSRRGIWGLIGKERKDIKLTLFEENDNGHKRVEGITNEGLCVGIYSGQRKKINGEINSFSFLL